MVLQDILTALLPEGLAQRVTYMDYGLHMVPRRMTTTLQETIKASRNQAWWCWVTGCAATACRASRLAGTACLSRG